MRMIKKKIYIILRSSLKRVGFLRLLTKPSVGGQPELLIKYLYKSKQRRLNLINVFQRVGNGGFWWIFGKNHGKSWIFGVFGHHREEFSYILGKPLKTGVLLR